MQRVVQAVVDIHTREVTDAQVPSNIALYAQWGGGKSFAKGESVPARGLCRLVPCSKVRTTFVELRPAAQSGGRGVGATVPVYRPPADNQHAMH